MTFCSCAVSASVVVETSSANVVAGTAVDVTMIPIKTAKYFFFIFILSFLYECLLSCCLCKTIYMKTVFKIWKKCVPYVGKMKKKCVLRFARKCGKAYN